jgi:hypothetical protein
MHMSIAGHVGADAPVAAAAHQRWRRLWPFRNNRWNNNRNVTAEIQQRDLESLPISVEVIIITDVLGVFTP